MACAGAHAGPHPRHDVPRAALVVEEGDVLLPRQPHHHPQAVPLGAVQEPAWRHGVDADRVKTVCRHLGEVLLDDLWVVLAAILGGAERPVSGAPNVELLIPQKDKLAPYLRSDTQP